MSRKERDRMTVMKGVKRQELTLVQTGELMAVRYRQSKRIWKRFQADGDAGLVHRLRGWKQKHRQWRERKPRLGALGQLDGSHHDWFEGIGPKCVLMVDGGQRNLPDAGTVFRGGDHPGELRRVGGLSSDAGRQRPEPRGRSAGPERKTTHAPVRSLLNPRCEIRQHF